MKSIAVLLACLVLLLTKQILFGQEGEEIPLIRYTPEFRFNDGIYLGIDDVKANNPIPLARIVSDRVEYDKDFFDELVLREVIILYDDAGVRASVQTKSIWSYALHGRLYIMVGGRFQRIILQGSISHFIAALTTSEKAYYADEDTSRTYTTTSDLYRSFYRDRYYYRTVTGQGELCLFDFESNTLSKYDHQALGTLLERDSLLFQEYDALRRKEKKNRMAEFIRRYNQRNPLYFPAE